MRSEEDVTRAIDAHADTVRRLCMVNLRNQADTDDVFQTVFMAFALRDEPFASAEHERAWMVRVTINACRDLQRSFFRRNTVPFDEALEPADPAPDDPAPDDHSEVLEAVLALPLRYRQVVYLRYYEEYSAVEIADILGKNVNTVYSLLARARRLLARKLGEVTYGA